MQIVYMKKKPLEGLNCLTVHLGAESLQAVRITE